MRFQRAQNFARQSRLCRSAVTQRKVAAFVFLVTFFFLLCALRLIERRLHFWIGPQSQRALPFRDGLIHLVHAVIRPARQLRHVGVLRRNPPRSFQIFQRLLVLAPPQMHVGHVHQQRRFFRSVRQRGAVVG